MSAPVFVVVGHVNKGKSSIVSTLTEDDTVAISKAPGTTTSCRAFPMRVDGELLFTLVDTPGFEQARHVLAWLRERETSAADRSEVVAAFLREHATSGEFPEECELLRPILEGGGILYVVDGSRPYSSEYEAEMEILRWTGQPRMALVNRIGSEDHVQTWSAALDQYFRLVRVFDAHEAEPADRLRLLDSIRALHEPWAPSIERAIRSLRQEQARRLSHTAREVADMIADMLSLVAEKRLQHFDDPEPYREDLEERYRTKMRACEDGSRRKIEALYQHLSFDCREADLELLHEDLFAEGTWLRLGLGRQELATTGAVGGALLGGGLDVLVGGASVFLGTLIGGVAGGAAGWLAKGRLAHMKVKGLPLGGKLLTYGPAKSAQLPWILLDRALLHAQAVSGRAHARRDALSLPAPSDREGPSSAIGLEQRAKLKILFDRLTGKNREESLDLRHKLAGQIETLLCSRAEAPPVGGHQKAGC